MQRFVARTTVALALGLGLMLILLLGLPKVEAAPTATTRYVAPWGDDTGNTCTSPITPCRTVQQAVNLSWSGDDEVLVAEGVYTATSGQVLFIQFTVVIRGGYSADFSTWDPQAHPTTLDGRGLMRVVYMLGDITPTLEGLRLTNGYVNGDGGGIYSVNAHPVISGCRIFSNTANSGEGGGVYLSNADNARLMDNEIFGSTAGSGTMSGGGIYLQQSDDVVLTNNLVLENHIVVGVASGVGIKTSKVRLLHTTLARNSGGRGRGIYAVDSTVWMTNTILASHTVGIEAFGGIVTATHTLWGTGAWANTADTVGSDVSIGAPAVNWHELPGFIDPNGGDYHIGTASGAIDKGVDVEVPADIDGDLRPFCGGPDLGADETICCANLNGTLYPTVQAAVDASTDPGDVVNDDYLVRSYGTPNVPGIVPVTTQINHAPMAEAGPSQSASPGTLVTLDGSGSSDPDDDPPHVRLGADVGNSSRFEQFHGGQLHLHRAFCARGNAGLYPYRHRYLLGCPLRCHNRHHQTLQLPAACPERRWRSVTEGLAL